MTACEESIDSQNHNEEWDDEIRLELVWAARENEEEIE